MIFLSKEDLTGFRFDGHSTFICINFNEITCLDDLNWILIQSVCHRNIANDSSCCDDRVGADVDYGVRSLLRNS